MKKAYLLIIAAALAFAGCSKDGPEHSDPNAWMYDESLPVPIMLGTPGAEAVTKAGEGILDGVSLPENTVIGVLGLEHGNQLWANTEEGSESVLIDCQEGATIDGSGNINFAETKFYPLTGGQNFTFYGYYPYKGRKDKTASISQTNVYELMYDIDGYTDILWAKSNAEDFTFLNPEDSKWYKVSGYNASYIRRVNKYGGDEKADYMPKLKFEHKLTYLKFKLRANEENWEDLKNHQVKVTSLTITNAYSMATLVVADGKEDAVSNISGQLTGRSGYQGSINLKGIPDDGIPLDGGVDDENVENQVYDVDFGDGLLLVPDVEYTANMTMSIVKSNGESDIFVADLKFTLPEKEAFKEGNLYNITIIVRAPQDVGISTELSEWRDEHDEIVIDQINNNSPEETDEPTGNSAGE